MGRKKKQEDDTDHVSLIGQRVLKEFQGLGKYSGSIVAYNAARGFYKIAYDDGDREELELEEVKQILVVEGDATLPRKRGRPPKQREEPPNPTEDVPECKRQKRDTPIKENNPSIRSKDPEDSIRVTRKRACWQSLKNGDNHAEEVLSPAEEVKENADDGRLDVKGQITPVRSSKRKRPRQDEECGSVPLTVKASRPSSRQAGGRSRSQNLLLAFDDEGSTSDGDEPSGDGAGSDGDEDDGLSSFDEDTTPTDLVEAPEGLKLPALVPLPISSKTIPLPDDLVVETFSIYNFLRSFSHALFLCPFCLDDFVDAVVTETPNHLIDSINLILLQALRRHLQRLSKDNCMTSRDCLRQRDWNLLDNITWPSFLTVFLTTHGFGKLYGQPISSLGFLDDEYYKASVKVKLAVLGFLCDHVLETEEIRAVLDAREIECTSDGSEIEMKHLSGKVVDVSEVHPSLVTKGHKESAADDSVHRAATSSTGPVHVESRKESFTDWNSDECVLCGMNGNLICCDGCPAAYHSRCVGISRGSLPPGDWFCPECIVDKVGGENSRRMRGLRGCYSLGVDPYGRSFMATCGHLVVLSQSDFTQLSYNYYARNDILGVLHSLELLKPFCDDIATAIHKYWDIPAAQFPIFIDSQELVSGNLPIWSEGGSNSEKHLHASDQYKLAQNKESVCRKAEGNERDGLPPQALVSDANTPLGSELIRAHSSDHLDVKGSLMGPLVSNPLAEQEFVGDHVSAKGSLQMVASDLNSNLSSSCTPGFIVSECDSKVVEEASENILSGPIASTSKPLERELAYTACPTQSSRAPEKDPYFSQNITERPMKESSSTLSQQEQLPFDQFQKAACPEQLRTVNFYRLSSYINHYVFGDAAATAAANLALLTADHLAPSDKAKKKTMTIAEQVNTFCKAPARFCWPSFRRKLMEVPKDRCGWCFTCTSNLKRGCLMNQAATQLAAGAARVAGGIRPGKSGSGHLPAVAGYLLHIEESLHSLLVGPWTNLMFRKVWRKRLETAPSIFDLKAALLNLEAHLRSVVLTEDWSKCIEDAPDMVLGGSVTSSLDDSLSKKASGKKMSRRLGATRRGVSKSESTALGAVQWARRGKVAHKVSGWATLSSKVARKAGRQGGFKKIEGIGYIDGEEVSKRSKQTAWRARVQAACTIAELAVQVRSLDSLIRWEDLNSKGEVQSAPNIIEDDGRTEITKFGVHAKSDKDGLLLYFIDSILIQTQGVRQNVSAANRLQNSKNHQVWVDERQVPLFLLKEFEENERASKKSDVLKPSALQSYHSEPTRSSQKKDLLKFLWERAGFYTPTKLVVSLKCKFCSLKVLASLAVQCHLCREPFHKECTVASHSLEKPDLKNTCCGCLKLTVGHKDNVHHRKKQEPISSLRVKKHENAKPVLDLPHSPQKIVLPQSRSHPPLPPLKLTLKPPVSATTSASLTKEEADIEVLGRSAVSAPKGSEKIIYEGVSWRKHDRKSRMRLQQNMLLPLDGSKHCSEAPKCYACKKQYQGDLVYIKCEYCPLWLHGAAVGVNQSNAKEVVGFKCHRCRKKGIPSCPYATKNQMHKGIVESSRFDDVCITKRTPLPLIRPGVNQQSQALPVPESSPAIPLECSTFKPSVETLLPTTVSLDKIQSYGHSTNVCVTKRTPLPFSRAGENQAQQQLASLDPGSIPATSLECAIANSPGETEPPVSTQSMGIMQQSDEGSKPVKSSVKTERLVNGITQGSMARIQSCVVGYGDEPQQLANVQKRVLQEGGQDTTGVDEEVVMEEDGNGETSTQATLSFMELLSSEDDRVEELAEVAMDFGGGDFDLFDLDMLMDSFGSCGASASVLNLEPEAPIAEEDPCQPSHVESQDVNQNTGFVADTADKICSVCSDGSRPSDLQCIGCGLAVHQQCLTGPSATSDTWATHGWTCDACKPEFLQSQDVAADRMQLIDSRILLLS